MLGTWLFLAYCLIVGPLALRFATKSLTEQHISYLRSLVTYVIINVVAPGFFMIVVLLDSGFGLVVVAFVLAFLIAAAIIGFMVGVGIKAAVVIEIYASIILCGALIVPLFIYSFFD